MAEEPRPHRRCRNHARPRHRGEHGPPRGSSANATRPGGGTTETLPKVGRHRRRFTDCLQFQIRLRSKCDDTGGMRCARTALTRVEFLCASFNRHPRKPKKPDENDPQRITRLFSDSNAENAMKIMRRTPLYAGLFLAPWVAMYGFSGLIFNHGNWFAPGCVDAPSK